MQAGLDQNVLKLVSDDLGHRALLRQRIVVLGRDRDLDRGATDLVELPQVGGDVPAVTAKQPAHDQRVCSDLGSFGISPH